MFDNLELPSNMVEYLTSITPILGIDGTITDHELFIFNNYLPLFGDKLLIQFPDDNIPVSLSLNILRKGDDNKVISGHKKEQLDEKFLQTTAELKVPYYIHSVISFEAKHEQTLDYQSKEKFVIYRIVSASSVEFCSSSLFQLLHQPSC